MRLFVVLNAVSGTKALNKVIFTNLFIPQLPCFQTSVQRSTTAAGSLRSGNQQVKGNQRKGLIGLREKVGTSAKKAKKRVGGSSSSRLEVTNENPEKRREQVVTRKSSRVISAETDDGNDAMSYEKFIEDDSSCKGKSMVERISLYQAYLEGQDVASLSQKLMASTTSNADVCTSTTTVKTDGVIDARNREGDSAVKAAEASHQTTHDDDGEEGDRDSVDDGAHFAGNQEVSPVNLSDTNRQDSSEEDIDVLDPSEHRNTSTTCKRIATNPRSADNMQRGGKRKLSARQKHTNKRTAGNIQSNSPSQSEKSLHSAKENSGVDSPITIISEEEVQEEDDDDLIFLRCDVPKNPPLCCKCGKFKKGSQPCTMNMPHGKNLGNSKNTLRHGQVIDLTSD